MIGGQALVVLPTMWAFVAFVFIFVGLRLYTRIHLIDSLGWDDHAYTASGVLLLACTVCIQVAAQYGFGQDSDLLSDDNAAKAKFWEIIGINVAFLAMAVAKWSFGLFLLRFVMERWQRLVIWCTIIVLLFLCSLTDILFWFQCLPAQSIWDSRVQGTCSVQISPCLKAMGMWGVFADMYLALVPWFCIWSLSMSKPEKITVAGSMSFGLVASICGIVRNVEIKTLDQGDYIEATANFVVWTAAEVFVTLVGIGIPILRPLLTRWFPKFWLFKATYKKNTGDLDSDQPAMFATHTIGGGTMLGAGPVATDQEKGQTRDRRGFPNTPSYLGIRGPTARTEISGMFGNESNDSIFFYPEASGSAALQKPNAIRIRDDVRVDFEPARRSSES